MELRRVPNNINIKIALITEFPQLLALRKKVFVEEQNCPEELEHDEYDSQAIHFLMEFEKGAGTRIIGTARLISFQEFWKIGRVAILKEFRGHGYGLDLMNFILETIEKMEEKNPTFKGKEVFLDSQVYAIPFYRKCGFLEEGEVFLDAGILHKKMKLIKN